MLFRWRIGARTLKFVIPILPAVSSANFVLFIDTKNEKLIAVTRSFQRTPPKKGAYDLTRDQRCALSVIINLTLVARVTLTHLMSALVMGPIEMLSKISL